MVYDPKTHAFPSSLPTLFLLLYFFMKIKEINSHTVRKKNDVAHTTSMGLIERELGQDTRHKSTFCRIPFTQSYRQQNESDEKAQNAGHLWWGKEPSGEPEQF